MSHQELDSFQPQRGLYNPAFEHDSCGIGFTADIKGRASHQIISAALEMLTNMEHRGATGAEPNTGDGAGLLCAMPHDFINHVLQTEMGSSALQPGIYGAGLVFLPSEPKQRQHCQKIVEKLIAERGQKFLGWRTVPVDPDSADLGPTARASLPQVEMLLVSAGQGFAGDNFDRELYIIRKRASHAIRGADVLPQAKAFYICSLSSKVLVYKGMLTSAQLGLFYPDLNHHLFASHVAIIHSRFSTNTFPSWDRAQPGRYLSHNGEINTLRGNLNWMQSRQGLLRSEYFSPEDLKSLFPICEPDCSDSGNFDNALELLLMSGRTLPEAISMMIPVAWQGNPQLPEEVRDFYEYNSCVIEPWDGPASIVITDGKYVGAVLDRNGLRPSRYYITHDDRIIMASEVGVLGLDPKIIKEKGRLQPGRIFLVDFEEGRIIPDEELKAAIAAKHPYGVWIRNQRLELKKLQPKKRPPVIPPEKLIPLLKCFGYTAETLHFMLAPIALEKRDPIGSMGNDSCLACLSDEPRLVYDYFKQLFAQVTNPPIDSIREEVIMSLECHVGPEQSLLETSEQHCHRLMIRHPIMRNERFQAAKYLDHRGWKSKIIDITYPADQITGSGANPAGAAALLDALNRICGEAEEAIDQGYSLLVLTDRAVAPDRIALSSLLATGAVHHHLVRKSLRSRVGLLVESAEAREVHHFCLLIGYGADGVNPYLAYEALCQARRDGMLDDKFADDYETMDAYRAGIAKGILKVMARMGISTLQSYKGAQIFEALGIKNEVIERCFAGTPSRLQGVGFDVLTEEGQRRHELGFPRRVTGELLVLENRGEFHWRNGGEKHVWNPYTITALQQAARENSREAYEIFAKLTDDDSRCRCTLRGLLKFKKGVNGGPIPLEEVEPAKEIVKRFVTGAMSYGSISPEAHETLAIAMNRMGGKSNTGEGGEDPARFKPLPNGDSKRSAIKQVASGRFGVTAWYLTNATELQIKMAQGAKPGEGGELPGRKVNEMIARIRYSTPGVGLISPPPHHDIYSIEDLKQLIYDLKCSNPSARVSVKLVAEVGVGTVAAGVAKAFADHILISGDVGGTGASPLTSIKCAGLPWEIGLAEAHQTLVLNDLRSRVTLQTDGGLKTGRDMVIAALLGAEEFGFATAPLVTLGCVMMRKCHLNTCPVGVATQDPALRKKFAGKPEYIINYLFMLAEHARRIMAELGFRRVDELVGRVDVLEVSDAVKHWKSDGLDLTPLLTKIEKPNAEVRCLRKQELNLSRILDVELIARCQSAFDNSAPVSFSLPIKNTHRAVGTLLSHEVVKRWGEHGLVEDTIRIKFNGSAGQSFGAFLCGGITLELEGDANDYVGKGLSEGKIVIYPPVESAFKPEENILVGNVVLYGATAGQAFFRGRAAERFCVRNSGAQAVVEGVGDHGCEYMTGGRAVILGPTGRNFAAGMSGGVAYVWDPDQTLAERCNLNTVALEPLEEEQDIYELYTLINLHLKYTGSAVADRIIQNWNAEVIRFVKVMPTDYKRVLRERTAHDEEIETSARTERIDG